MIEEDKLNALELLGENEYLHKEIERLNNIIDNLDMMLKTLIMESEFAEHKLTAQILLMNLNELRGFNKGEDKE